MNQFKYTIIMVRILFTVIVVVGWLLPVTANDVRIRGEAKVQAINENTALITFPLSWEHSWRENESWDGVYLFVKYRRVGVNEPWHHAYLKEEGHRATGGGKVPAMEFLPVKVENWNVLRYDTIYVGNYYPTSIFCEPAVTGVFLFRRVKGNGNIDIPRVSLEWDFKQGDLNLYHDVTIDDIRNNRIEVSVQAVEMVFVPNGPYYLGDRISGYSFVSKDFDSAHYMDTDDSVKVYIMGSAGSTGVKSAWVVPDLYPTGYTGFYTMKYEVSQEQYVNFLNRITYADQKKRIENDLDALKAGQFAFGRKDLPNYRNGIILQERFSTRDTAVIFGFDINGDNPINSDDDGKSIACGFLTPDDMRAYADWIGLRPHSEMEYEKSARQRNPAVVANARSFAWGTPNYAPLQSWNQSTVSGDNSEEEKVLIPNATGYGRMNGPKVHNLGPVRCGAFATETSDIYTAGASQWGLMELTGNLAEIYYNARQGKEFNGRVFGDGNIWSTVASWRTDTTVHVYQVFSVGHGNYTVVAYKTLPMWTINKKNHQMKAIVRQAKSGYCGSWLGCRVTIDEDVTVPWPVLDWPTAKENFILKGGSFATAALATTGESAADRMAVSYRGDTVYAKAVPGELRYPYAGFRVGRSVPMKTVRTGTIALAGDRSVDTAVVCALQPYDITEIEPGDDTPETTIYIWERDDDGQGWQALENSNVRGWTENACLVKEQLYTTYRYRRQSIASHAQSFGNTVTLVVPGYVVNGGQDYLELNPYVSSIALTTELGAPGRVKVEWCLKTSGTWHPLTDHAGVTKDVVNINRSDLTSEIVLNNGGACQLRITVTIGNCSFVKLLEMPVRQASVACPSSVTDNEGNTYAVAQLKDGSCWMTQNSKVTVGGAVAAGGLYTWSEVEKYGNALCPPGFSLPTVNKWDLLTRFYAHDMTSGDCDVMDYIGRGSDCVEEGVSAGFYSPGLDDFMNAVNVPLSTSAALGQWWAMDVTSGTYVNIQYDTSDPWGCMLTYELDASAANPFIPQGKHPIRCYKN